MSIFDNVYNVKEQRVILLKDSENLNNINEYSESCNLQLSFNTIKDETTFYQKYIKPQFYGLLTSWIFGPEFKRVVSFHGDMNFDSCDDVYHNIHGVIKFSTSFASVEPIDLMHYTIYNSENELLFEFDSHFLHIDDVVFSRSGDEKLFDKCSACLNTSNVVDSMYNVIDITDLSLMNL